MEANMYFLFSNPSDLKISDEYKKKENPAMDIVNIYTIILIVTIFGPNGYMNI